jgi:hypothetical protein
MNNVNEIELYEGEELCPKCKGKGETYNLQNDWGVKWQMCDRCWGEGKLDWIEMAMGKKQPMFGSSSSSSVSSSSSTISSTISTKLSKEVKNDTKRLCFGWIRNFSDDFRQFHEGKKRPMERQFYSSRYRGLSIKDNNGLSSFLRPELS